MFKNIRSVLGVFAVGLMLAVTGLAQAATANYPANFPVQMVPFHVSGQYTASTTSVIKFALPFKAKIVGVSATARASGGTNPTLTVDVKEATVSILSAPISITAGTVAEGTITDSLLADEAAITVDLAITGTNPTWNDITIVLTLVRL